MKKPLLILVTLFTALTLQAEETTPIQQVNAVLDVALNGVDTTLGLQRRVVFRTEYLAGEVISESIVIKLEGSNVIKSVIGSGSTIPAAVESLARQFIVTGEQVVSELAPLQVTVGDIESLIQALKLAYPEPEPEEPEDEEPTQEP